MVFASVGKVSLEVRVSSCCCWIISTLTLNATGCTHAWQCSDLWRVLHNTMKLICCSPLWVFDSKSRKEITPQLPHNSDGTNNRTGCMPTDQLTVYSEWLKQSNSRQTELAVSQNHEQSDETLWQDALTDEIVPICIARRHLQTHAVRRRILQFC